MKKDLKRESEKESGVYSGTENECSLTTTRRPYFRLRGNRLTPHQAWEIIRRTDNIGEYGANTAEGRRLTALARDLPGIASDGLGSINLNQWHLTDQHYPAYYGWITPDGYLAHNGIFQKYPTMEEFREEFTQLANEFPFLDMVIAITDCNEYCSANLKVYQFLKDVEDPFGYRDIDEVLSVEDSERAFLEEIVGGYWIHDGKLDFLNSQEMHSKYAMYNQYARESMGVPESERIGVIPRGGVTRRLADKFIQYCLVWERFLSDKVIIANSEQYQDMLYSIENPKFLGRLRSMTDSIWVSKYVYDTADFESLELDNYDLTVKVMTPDIHAQWEKEVMTRGITAALEEETNGLSQS